MIHAAQLIVLPFGLITILSMFGMLRNGFSLMFGSGTEAEKINYLFKGAGAFLVFSSAGAIGFVLWLVTNI